MTGTRKTDVIGSRQYVRHDKSGQNHDQALRRVLDVVPAAEDE
jgi:hypothetical protein